MAIAKRIDEATSTVQDGLRTSLQQINAQLDQAEQENRRMFQLRGACPWVLQQLGRLGAGQIPLEEGEAVVAQALVTDMANGVKDVIQFGSMGNTEVHQTVALGGGASWSALQSFVGESLDHLG